MAFEIAPIHRIAQQQPTCTAVKAYGLHMSYRELSQRVLALGAQLLDRGLRAGDSLGCISHNNIEMIILYWACVDIGVLFFPLSPRFPDAQIQDLMHTYRIKYYWCALPERRLSSQETCELKLNQDGKHDPAGSLPHIPIAFDWSRPANVILTSGSSGTPKAAVHCLANHVASATGAASVIALSAGDAWLLALPIFHIGGLAILNRCALAGACVVLADPQIDFNQQLGCDAITHVSLVPTQLHRLLHADHDNLLHLKAILLGGAAVDPTILTVLADYHLNVYTSYGMTEMSSQITTGFAEASGGSGGLLPNRELKIDAGVIWVRGACLFMGYLTFAKGTLKVISATDKEGWFCTQDSGEWNSQGQLVLLGRVDNLFVCGGENIHPEEIEAALKAHPQIEEAIVFAESDVEFGCLPAAVIRGHFKYISANFTLEIESFLATRLARFKRPRRYYVWPLQYEQHGMKVNRSEVIRYTQTTSACR